MCEFCDNLEYKSITVPVRTSMADDNVCEVITGDDCSKCNHGCADENNYFEITTWEDNLSLSYCHKIGKLTMDLLKHFLAHLLLLLDIKFLLSMSA